MTTPSINPGGAPLSAVAGLGQRHRDGSEKNSDVDFAGLLSRLSVQVETSGGAKSDQTQPFVAGATIDTMLAGVRNGQSAPSPVQAHNPQGDVDETNAPAVEAASEETTVVAGEASVGEEDLSQAVRSGPDDTVSIDGLASHDAATASIVETNDGRSEEIQVLLSSVMRSVPLEAGAMASHAPVKTFTVAATPLPGARVKAGDETTGIATQVANDEPASEAQSSPDVAWLEPVQAGPDHQGDSTAPRSKEQSLVAALVGDTKISVLQTQTHHAPVLHGGPMAQIAESIRAELTAGGETSLRWSPSVSAAAKPGADAPVKVLLIQLQPADLGTVTVRMSLKEDALELHIEASQQETAQRLQQDQDSLSKVLRSAGYLIDSAAIRVTEPDRSLVLPSQGSASLSQSSHQGTMGGAPSEGGASHGRGQHEHAARGHSGQTGRADANGQGRPTSSGLYV